MNTRLLHVWDRCSGSFWFLPALLVFVAAAGGVMLPWIEHRYLGHVKQWAWLATGPEGARTVLSVIAGAMITVSGVIFSLTMATLSIASSQFGSRVLRQRVRNRATQFALGTFLGTSVFCFLALRSVEQGDGLTFVPHISVAVGIAAAVLSVFVLIYFIQDVAEAVQAPHVVSRLAADLNDSIDRLFPECIGQSETDDDAPSGEDLEFQQEGVPHAIEAESEGHLQAIDADLLLDTMQQHDGVIQLLVRPGEFLMKGDPVASVWGAEGNRDQLDEVVRDALIVGITRTPQQDVNCAVHELAQLTIRALSPGINDPFTAMDGIDRLAAAMGRLAQRKLPSKFRLDASGKPRVVADRVTFPEALAAAFNHIRQHASSSPPVGIRLLEGLASIARKARRQEDREAIERQAQMVLDGYQRTQHLEADLKSLNEQFRCVQEALKKQHRQGPSEITRQSASANELDSQATETDSETPPAEGEING